MSLDEVLSEDHGAIALANGPSHFWRFATSRLFSPPSTVIVTAVADMTFSIRAGEQIAVVGDRVQANPSLRARSSSDRLPGAEIRSGSIIFRGREGVTLDLATLKPDGLRSVRATTSR